MRYLSEPWGVIIIAAAILGIVAFLWLAESNRQAAEREIQRMEADVRARAACGPDIVPVYQQGAIAIWPCG